MDLKQNFLSVDGNTARSSYGEFFEVGEMVEHQDTHVGQATILSFQGIKSENEVKVFTDKGYCHLDFLVKLETATT